MKNKRIEYKIGILAFAMSMLIKYFIKETINFNNPIVDFFQGAMIGIAIAFLLISVLSEEKYTRLKSFKKNIFKNNK